MELLCNLFDKAGPKIYATSRFRAVSGSALRILKSVWMCLIAPRTNTFRFCNGLPPIGNSLSFKNEPLVESSGSKIENYISPNHCAVVIDSVNKHTIVRFDSSSGDGYYDLKLRAISAIPKLLPWLFEDENKLTPEEYAFLQYVSSLSEVEFGQKNYEAFLSSFQHNLNYFIKKYGYDLSAFKDAAYILTAGYRKNRIDDITKSIENCNMNIEMFRGKIYENLNEIEKLNRDLNWMQSHDDATVTDELTHYLSSGNIRIVHISGAVISFNVLTTLSCYDENMIDSYVLHEDNVLRGVSYFGRQDTTLKNPYSTEQMQAFYKAVFVDRIYEIKMAAQYSINAIPTVTPSRKEDPMEPLDKDYINNPHITFAGCLGNYTDDLTYAAKRHDVIASFAICQQSASNVSLGETWAMGRVTQMLVASTGNVIRTKDGDITFKQAMKQLAKQEDSPNA